VAHLLLVGPGDLGERIVYQLLPSLQPGDVLTIAGRSSTRLSDIVHMASMQAKGRAMSVVVHELAIAIEEADRWQEWLTRWQPDLVIFTATLQSWWNLPVLPPTSQQAAERAGFGIWLPFQAALLLQFSRYLHTLSRPPWLLIGPYPDATAPLVRAQGLSRVIGFGNVDELAMTIPGEVRLIAHHSVETALFHDRPLPPYKLWVRHQGADIPKGLTKPFAWPDGTRSHVWTAASAVRMVQALRQDTPVSVHAPGPLGLPGGYPLEVCAHGIQWDLPASVTLAQARAINEAAACADGIDQIGEDGTVRLTQAAQFAVQAIFGVDAVTWSGDESDWLHRAHDLRKRLRERVPQGG